jgi:hypothetical protein
MALKDIIAGLRRVKPETQAALKAEGIDLDALEAETADATTMAALQQEITRMNNAALHASAEAFWGELIKPDKDGRQKVVWSQKADVIATFEALALLDGGGKAVFGADNSLVVGDKLAAYKKSMQNAPGVNLSATEIPDQAPDAKPTTTPLMESALKHAARDGKISKAMADKAISNLNGSAGGGN